MKNSCFDLSVENENSPPSGSLPLPEDLRGSLDEKIPTVYTPQGASGFKSVAERMKDPEFQRLRREGQRNSFNKDDYLRAARTHCQVCHGPGDCEAGPMLDEDNSSDGCHLYVLTRQYPKRGLRMAAVRKIMKAHCVDCVGLYKEKLDETLCQSPECSMYRVRFGRKKRPVTDPVSSVNCGPEC